MIADNYGYTVISETNVTRGYKEPERKLSHEEVDYLNTKKASKKLYNNKKRIVVKKLPVNKALLPRKVI
jgi:hypothetical protein